MAQALAMCQIAYAEGTRMMAATVHQNERWPDVTPNRIRDASQALAAALREAQIPIAVFPCAEVMAFPEMVTAWQRGELLSVAERGQYLLVEMPHGLFVDLRHIITRFRQLGVRVLLAHPERSPELLHDKGLIEDFIRAGCIVQVSTHSITAPTNRADERALKRWFQRGIVHVLGSDGHSETRRPPRIADAYRQIVSWVGNTIADRVASTNGLAILQGLPLQLDPPQRPRRNWFNRLWQEPSPTYC
jgi:protein-tyrosine phosphatase